MEAFAFNSRDEYLAALDQVLRQATRLVRIKEADLRGQGWDRPARTALLEAFLREKRARRVEVLLHDKAYLTGYCPLLMKLLRHYSHQMEIRIYEEISPSEECYVLGDDTWLLRRYHWEDWRGRFEPDDRPTVTLLAEQFLADWERLPGSLGYTPLGL